MISCLALGLLFSAYAFADKSIYGGNNFPVGIAGGDDDLSESVPGNPGQDYPIFSEVPDTSFVCDGQVDGGYYADPEAECQAFHICANDGYNGLSKFSFLCPNGTLFDQQYFICNWWFNVDCSEAESLYSLNDEIAAEREANSPSAEGLGSYGGGNSGGGQGSSNGRKSNGRKTGGGRGSQASASSITKSYSRPSPSLSGRGSTNRNRAPPSGGYAAPSDSFRSASSYGAPTETSSDNYNAPVQSRGNGFSRNPAASKYSATSSNSGPRKGSKRPTNGKSLSNRKASSGYSSPKSGSYSAPTGSISQASNGYSSPKSSGNGRGAGGSPSASGRGYSAPKGGNSRRKNNSNRGSQQSSATGYSAPSRSSGRNALSNGYSAPSSNQNIYSSPTGSSYSTPSSSTRNSNKSGKRTSFARTGSTQHNSKTSTRGSKPNSGYTSPADTRFATGYSGPTGLSSSSTGYGAPGSSTKASNGYEAPSAYNKPSKTSTHKTNIQRNTPRNGANRQNKPNVGSGRKASTNSSSYQALVSKQTPNSSPSRGYSSPTSGYSSPNSAAPGYRTPNQTGGRKNGQTNKRKAVGGRNTGFALLDYSIVSSSRYNSPSNRNTGKSKKGNSRGRLSSNSARKLSNVGSGYITPSDNSEDEYGTPGADDTYGAPSTENTYGAPGADDTYGAPGADDTYGTPLGGFDNTFGNFGDSAFDDSYTEPEGEDNYGAPSSGNSYETQNASVNPGSQGARGNYGAPKSANSGYGVPGKSGTGGRGRSEENRNINSGSQASSFGYMSPFESSSIGSNYGSPANSGYGAPIIGGDYDSGSYDTLSSNSLGSEYGPPVFEDYEYDELPTYGRHSRDLQIESPSMNPENASKVPAVMN